MSTDFDVPDSASPRQPWSKGRPVGQKHPLNPKDDWASRVRLGISGSKRDLAPFNPAIGSKQRACDPVGLRVEDVQSGRRIRERTNVVQRKTGRPVRFDMTEATRVAVGGWITASRGDPGEYLFVSRLRESPHLSTRQESRIMHGWSESAGLDSSAYGTHTMRRSKAAQIYRKAGNLRAVQLPLGHTKLEGIVRYLGIEVDDALTICEHVEP